MPASRSLAVLTVAALLALLAPSPATAATSISIGSTTVDGSVLVVAGQATFGNQPFVPLGTDPAGDQLPPGPDVLGKDVRGFSMSASVSGAITLRWELGGFAPGLGRGVDVSYGKAFCVEPSGQCFVITFVDVAGALNSFVWGWTCADETCSIGAGDHTHTWETDAYDAAANTASATIPLTDLGITPGSELRAATSGTFGGSVWVTSPWWFNLDLLGNPPTYDTAGMTESYIVPRKAVSLAIAPAGQAPEDVAYGTEATVSFTDGFTGELDVSDLAPGEHTVYARACFGANNCGYATSTVTL